METLGEILLVEDSPITNDYISSVLQKHNYSVVPFLNGTDFLDYVMNNEVACDLVLLDVVLPDLSGFEVLRKWNSKKKNKAVPIIFLTGRGDKDDKIKGLQLGAVDYLTKPFDETEMLLRVKTHLDLYQTQNRLKDELTRRREYERKIKLKNDELRNLNATKDKFFSILAHDLKNPIYGFVGLTGLLVKSEDFSIDKIKELVSIIHSSSKDLQTLLETLLDWGRFQANKVKFVPEIVNLFKITESIAKLYQNVANDKNIAIEIEIEEGLMLFADTFMLQTVIRNLVSNGLKFTSEGGTVKVLAESTENVILLKISDTGIGIKTEKIKELFNLEKSMSTTGTNNEKGTGLGLILCKEFVEKHKGTIAVESETGVGTTFICSFPKQGDIIS